MSECQIQTGIFVLKVCGKPSDCDCMVCGKHICYRHSRHNNSNNPNSAKVCLECYTKQNRYSKDISRDSNRRDYDYWYFYQRNSFFRDNSHHRPFDENDYQNFERENETDFDDDSKTGNFFDS